MRVRNVVFSSSPWPPPMAPHVAMDQDLVTFTVDGNIQD